VIPEVGLLLERISSDWPMTGARLSCYACLFSLPPQSILEIILDSLGVKINRTLNISTPETGILELIVIK